MCFKKELASQNWPESKIDDEQHTNLPRRQFDNQDIIQGQSLRGFSHKSITIIKASLL